MSLSTLYDKLESQLRSLETLGVTSEKYAAMLFPLVESCLPEDLLRVWQRSLNTYDDEESPRSSSNSSIDLRLKKLMTFLKKEVEDEEKISMAVSGFDSKSKSSEKYKENLIPSASGLINHQKSSDSAARCVFCKSNHKSEDCKEALKMTLGEKKKILSSRGCCHFCIKFGHIARRCRVNVQCNICKNRHVTLMCPKDVSSEENNKPNTSNIQNSATVDDLSNNTSSQVFLQTLLVELTSDICTKYVRAIIDTGSQRSYINKFIASEMGYECLGEETLIHALFGGAQSEIVKHAAYRIQLRNLNKKYVCTFQALDQPIICSNVICIKEGPWSSELKNLNIDLSDTRDGPIDVLIGADIAGKLLTGRKHILTCGLVAIETNLGWTLMGKSTTSCFNIHKSTSILINSLFCKSHQISNLWSLDVLGISDPVETKTRRDLELQVLEHFHKTVQINEEGRYEVIMPWIEGHPSLPRNFNLAKRRLDNLMIKLQNDGYYDDYNNVFLEWLSEGIIEYVPEDEIENEGYYLPHRHVVKLNSSTTKLRPVFDASAREKGSPSLNQCIEKGVNLIELIPSILIRFRLHKIGIIADIRKAFLQISLHKLERDYLRFLWFDEDGKLLHLRHARVVFGVTCSPFLLGAVIQYHLSNSLQKCLLGELSVSEQIIRKLLKSFYVDNCVTSLDSEEELQEFMEQSIQIMQAGRFDLRCWEYTVMNPTDSNYIDTVVSSVLGMKWNRLSDTMGLNFEWFHDLGLEIITKRYILSIANKIFDPIGFVCPVSLFPKILLKKIWSQKLGWDQVVPEDISKTFLCWIQELSSLANLRIPRWFLKTCNATFDSWSLHMFCDASQEAYAAVVFIRSEDFHGESYIQLVQAKTRVSPIKKMSIPRLELLAATIGARLISSILEIFAVEIPTYCWTDSTTTLSWIKQEDQWKTFVWNRVKEIRSLTQKENWRYIPGYLNPADLPSRGCNAKQLLESKWWEGPFWLLQKPTEWPVGEYEADESIIVEEKKSAIVSCFNYQTDSDWYYRYFSSYSKIINMVAWIRRFANNCRYKTKWLSQRLSLEETENSEKIVIKMIQREVFTGLGDKSLSSLCPYEDEDGIYRLKTKITHRDDLFDFRHPIILPSNHTVVVRMIYKCHVENCHIGIQGLLCKMREKFWIIKGRKSVRSVINKCVVCKRFNANNLKEIPVALPKNRVRDVSVFEVIGVDLAGPLFIRSNQKVWICIFTCAIYRAVHLELVNGLSTDSFLQAFRKFISRRGRPSIVYSDNGTNFVGAENLFSKIDWNKVSEYSVSQRFVWKFNPPTGAWWGGWWERLIRLMKQLLRKTLGKTSLSYDELATILCECEALMNERPLTYVSEDCHDLVPLTPSMFLHDLRETGVPDIDNVDANYLNRHAKYRIKLKEELTRRFRSEYLSQLIIRPKKCQKYKIQVGDIVIVGSDMLKRLDWPLGIVTEVFPGKDGQIRVVRLKTSSGYITRPIQRLHLLEIHAEDCDDIKERLENQEQKIKSRNKEEKVIENMEGSPLVTRFGREIKKPVRYPANF